MKTGRPDHEELRGDRKTQDDAQGTKVGGEPLPYPPDDPLSEGDGGAHGDEGGEGGAVKAEAGRNPNEHQISGAWRVATIVQLRG